VQGQRQKQRREQTARTTATTDATAKSDESNLNDKSEMRGFFPFDYAQGQNDK
jgi:hypothetical protein